MDVSLKEYYNTLEKLLSSMQSDKELFEMIVNGPFHNKLHTTHLDLGIVVLLLVDKNGKTLNRIALSDTEPARWAVKMTPVAFHDIKIPLTDKTNILVQAVKTGKPRKTSDWKFLFTPILSPEAARFNQAGAGIACSYAYPLIGARNGGTLIFSFYQPLDHIQVKHLDFMEKYSQKAAKALSGSQS
jgi:hypothetical protein